MNDFLATVPFDLYELGLFHLVAEEGSFTRAGQKAGLTQSAMTRQIRGVEDQLGVALFERTTRRVGLTPAGRLLYEKSKPILAAAEATLQQLQQDFALIPQTLRVAVDRSIGLACFPGFFFAFRKQMPAVQLHVQLLAGAEIIAALDAKTLDAGLLAPPKRLPNTLTATHRFADSFVLIAPPDSPLNSVAESVSLRSLRKRLVGERWLMIDRQGTTGESLQRWLRAQQLELSPAIELDSFDVIVNLVALGLGCSFVPHRVLALYGDRRKVSRVSTKPRFTRELAVVVRKNRQQPEPLATFIESILF